MGKMKVHELAKELEMQSKELVEKIQALGYDVKSHLSMLEEAEIKKIKKALKGESKSSKKEDSKKEETKKAESKKESSKKEASKKEVAKKEEKKPKNVSKEEEKKVEPPKKEKKPIAPVIIRREVTRIENTTPEVKREAPRRSMDDFGVVQRRTDTSMNIKYRTPPRKIGSITPSVPNNEVPTETPAPKVETPKQEEIKQPVKEPEVKPIEKKETKEEKQEVQNETVKERASVKVPQATAERVIETPTKKEFNNKPFNRFDNQNRTDNRFNNNQRNYQDRNQNGDFRNRENRPFNQNRDGAQNRTFNRDGNRPFNKEGGRPPFNKDGNKPPFNKDRKPGNNQGGFRQNQPRESKIEKDIKGVIASTEPAQKESTIVRTGYKDKEKDSRKFEEQAVKKTSKSKAVREMNEDINYGKLKDLQTENHFSNMFDDTESKMFDYYDLSNRKKGGAKKSKKKQTESVNHIEQKIFELTDIDIGDSITVKNLAEKLKKQASEVIKKLMGYGILATVNNELDFDTAFLVANEFGVTAHKKEVVSDEEILFDDTEDNEEDLVPRPPVVVVMGHVDHGKTSLLDAIRSTNVIEREAGGITQHIGAYKVEINDREITFLDTPGHEAFTAMRARGAQVTDVAVIIVAADDGIMPQTVEAINHAKAAGVSIIVAINKIDKEGANIDKVKQELTEYGLVPEEWGGDTICVPISAKQHKNIDALLEMVLLVADMKDLKTNPKKQSKGTVLEARLDKNTGITASLLVQRGTLNIGDTIVVGSVIGKIRGMVDDKGQKVKSAGPSTPVEVIGLPEVPEAGEIFYEVENEKVAKHLIEKRKSKQREEMIQKSAPVTLDNLFNQIEEGKLKDLNIIIKADVQGSVQAIRSSLEKIQNEEARVRIIHAAVGGITESDVTLAKVTNAIVIGFNVRPEANAKSIADKEKVQINLYSVIYNAIDDVTAALNGMLKPKYKEVIQGTAEIRQVFKITNVGMIAGCYVTEGKIVRNSGLRVIRDNVVIHTGKLSSLKRMKDDAREVAEGYECGVQIEDYSDIKVGDKIESYTLEEIKK